MYLCSKYASLFPPTLYPSTEERFGSSGVGCHLCERTLNNTDGGTSESQSCLRQTPLTYVVKWFTRESMIPAIFFYQNTCHVNFAKIQRSILISKPKWQNFFLESHPLKIQQPPLCEPVVQHIEGFYSDNRLIQQFLQLISSNSAGCCRYFWSVEMENVLGTVWIPRDGTTIFLVILGSLIDCESLVVISHTRQSSCDASFERTKKFWCKLLLLRCLSKYLEEIFNSPKSAGTKNHVNDSTICKTIRNSSPAIIGCSHTCCVQFEFLEKTDLDPQSNLFHSRY